MSTRQFVALLRKDGQDTVITWGFVPIQDDAEVQDLRRLGFTMVWFGGDHAAALRHFNKRGDIPETLFHDQMARISGMNLPSFGATQLDPFDAAGNMKPVEERARLVLAIP